MYKVLGILSLLMLAACSAPATDTPANTAGDALAKDASATPGAMAKEASGDAMPDATAKDDGVETDGVKAPAFSGTTTSGKQVSLDSYLEEKPLVIYFMASWCPKCAQNWAALNEVYPEYEERVNFIAISVDPTDTQPVLEELAAEKGFVFDTIPGSIEIPNAFGVSEQTAKVAIAQDGTIVKQHKGVLSADEWRAFFDSVA